MIADTGPIIAWLNQQDRYHAWAQELTPLRPWITLESCLAEAAWTLKSPQKVVRLSEKLRREKIATVDKEHFSILRRFHRERLPLILP